MVETDTVANNLVNKSAPKGVGGSAKTEGGGVRFDDASAKAVIDSLSKTENEMSAKGFVEGSSWGSGENSLKSGDEKSLLGVLVTCPQCSKPYQIMNPQEALVYQCQQCQTQFLVRKESGGKFQALKWSEEQILKILFDVPGETGQSQVVRAWRNAFDNLTDVKAHEQFVFLCRQKNSLNLAREKYKQLAMYLNWDGLPEYLKVILEPNRAKLSPWAERMPWMLLGLAALLILLGSVMQGHRNMIGAGVLVGIIDFLVYRKRFKVLF